MSPISSCGSTLLASLWLHKNSHHGNPAGTRGNDTRVDDSQRGQRVRAVIPTSCARRALVKHIAKQAGRARCLLSLEDKRARWGDALRWQSRCIPNARSNIDGQASKNTCVSQEDAYLRFNSRRKRGAPVAVGLRNGTQSHSLLTSRTPSREC